MSTSGVGLTGQPMESHGPFPQTSQNIDVMPTSYSAPRANANEGSALLHKASPTSRLATVGNMFKTLGRGIGQVVGGIIATVGTVPAALLKGVMFLASFAGAAAGGVVGGLIGFAIGACIGKPVAGIKTGAQIGFSTGAVIGAVVSGLALGIPYALADGITKCGTKLMAASGASREVTQFFHVIAAMPKVTV